MEKIYIHRKLGFYRSEETLGANYMTGTSWADVLSGCFLMLDSSQKAFMNAHAGASIEEVFNKQLNEAVPYQPTLEEARTVKLSAIDAYDSSSSVNEFFIGGMSMWLDRETRVSLLSTIDAEESAGRTTTTLWTQTSPPFPVDLPITLCRSLLQQLEIYAKDSFGTTQQHKAAVYMLQTVEQVAAYDHTTGYPEKLNITLN